MRKEFIIIFVFIFAGIAVVTFYVPVVNFMEAVINPQEVYLRKERELLGNTLVVNAKVKDIQKSLTALGFKPGVVDGQLGNKTRVAMKAFQKKNKLKATGWVNEQTLTDLKRQAQLILQKNKKKKAVTK